MGVKLNKQKKITVKERIRNEGIQLREKKGK